jgi:hypothetical protein
MIGVCALIVIAEKASKRTAVKIYVFIIASPAQQGLTGNSAIRMPGPLFIIHCYPVLFAEAKDINHEIT